MWSNSLRNIIEPLKINFNQQIRTTYILKRRWEPKLHKKGDKPKPLRGRHYVYDLIKDTTIEKQPNIKLILTSYVDGYGNIGDEISVKPTVAYKNLLLPGLAVYSTPDNLKKYYKVDKNIDKEQHSSPFAQRTVNVMSKIILSIIMNKDVPWTLEPWHVRASFRKAGYHVAEDAIKLPDTPINGPDLSLQEKEFYVTITVNNLEKFKVKCRIHHWSKTDRLPYVFEYWKIPREPLFPDDPSQIPDIKSD